jgi:hypothetical protein
VKRKKEVRSELNLLTLVPRRAVEWRKTEDGLVELLKPKYQHPWLVKHLLPRLRRPNYRIRLDEIGSYFWENCDGRLTIEEIASRQKQRFGERVEPLYDRIQMFLGSLERHRFIVLNTWNGDNSGTR